MYGTVATGTGYMHLFVLLLMLLVQLNCGLQFLENKILFVSLASAINVRYVTIFLHVSNLTHQASTSLPSFSM